jgi:hypothetical protein
MDNLFDAAKAALDRLWVQWIATQNEGDFVDTKDVELAFAEFVDEAINGDVEDVGGE